MLAMIFTDNTQIIAISYALLTAGVGIYDFMYPLMYSVYVPRKIRTFMMVSRYDHELGYSSNCNLLWREDCCLGFSKIMGTSYAKASILSGNQAHMKGSMLHNYITSYKSVIYIAIGFTVLAFICSLFLKERPSDYTETEAELAERKAKKAVNFKMLAQKDIVLFVTFLALIRVGAYLVTPYFPIYLNNFLHIHEEPFQRLLLCKPCDVDWLYICTVVGKETWFNCFNFSHDAFMYAIDAADGEGEHLRQQRGNCNRNCFVPPFRLGQRFNAGPTVIANGACPEKLTARI